VFVGCVCELGLYKEETILNNTVFLSGCVAQYGEEQKLKVTVFVVRVWGEIYRGNDTECCCVCCEGVRGSIDRK
jgi:hypothetical protein